MLIEDIKEFSKSKLGLNNILLKQSKKYSFYFYLIIFYPIVFLLINYFEKTNNKEKFLLVMAIIYFIIISRGIYFSYKKLIIIWEDEYNKEWEEYSKKYAYLNNNSEEKSNYKKNNSINKIKPYLKKLRFLKINKYINKRNLLMKKIHYLEIEKYLKNNFNSDSLSLELINNLINLMEEEKRNQEKTKFISIGVLSGLTIPLWTQFIGLIYRNINFEISLKFTVISFIIIIMLAIYKELILNLLSDIIDVLTGKYHFEVLINILKKMRIENLNIK